MRSLFSASHRFLRGPLGPVAAGVALALLATLSHSWGLPTGETVKTFADTLPPARNPQRLHLIVDPLRVFGWISGTTGHRGAAVRVESNGHVQKVAVGRGNTFSWDYKVAKATRVTFTVAGLSKTIDVQPPAPLPPCVFFAVDRGVYRPKQTLRFAAFLRDLDAQGEFTPRPARNVEVRLTSVQKNTTAACLQLTADARGKLTGEYTFRDADPLDDYRLTIPGYKGAARVRLAEYRKTQVRLHILSQRIGSQLRLRFQARDYLDRPIKASRVQYLAQIVSEPAHAAAAALDAKQFAYAADADQPSILRWEDLTLEERQLAEADASYRPLGGLNVGRSRKVVAQIEGKVVLEGRGEGVQALELRKSWLKPGYSVVVRGVLIDGNGREERQTKSIPLMESGDKAQLTLSQSVYRVNEPIRVSIRSDDPADRKGMAALVAFRLSVSPPPLPRMPQNLINAGVRREVEPFFVDDWSDIHREPAATVRLRAGSATLRLKEPGAYVLVAVGYRPDGGSWRREVGCTVLPNEGLAALRLQLDRDTYSSGDKLTGTIYSKYGPRQKICNTLLPLDFSLSTTEVCRKPSTPLTNCAFEPSRLSKTVCPSFRFAKPTKSIVLRSTAGGYDTSGRKDRKDCSAPQVVADHANSNHSPPSNFMTSLSNLLPLSASRPISGPPNDFTK